MQHKIIGSALLAYFAPRTSHREGRALMILLLSLFVLPTSAQTYSLDQLRQLALDNNKQLKVAQIRQDIADDAVKAAKTRYLPRVNALAGYELYSREISLLNNHQKSTLDHLGSDLVSNIEERFGESIANLQQDGFISEQDAAQLGGMLHEVGTPIAEKGDSYGQRVERAFRTNTHNLFAGSVMVTQPVYMGGAISASNEMARISQQMAATTSDNLRRNTLLSLDNAYWMAVSLKNKEQLARQFLSLVEKLHEDVDKLIREGVATRADGLKVSVAVNEAEMAVTRVEDGVALTKMYLCQLCGLPLNSNLALADEGQELRGCEAPSANPVTDSLFSNRPEIQLLESAIDLSKQSTKLVQALYRPHIALTGGVLVSNPNVYNGFERKFKDNWNIGILVQMPIWSWHEGRYKTRISRSTTRIAEMELQDAREKIALQVEQCRFKLDEAYKRLSKANSNMHSAEENLRCANVGFREGVMTVTNVMEAQTAWQKAESQRIDAAIDVILAQIALNHAVGN